jgi:hypothetical protein
VTTRQGVWIPPCEARRFDGAQVDFRSRTAVGVRVLRQGCFIEPITRVNAAPPPRRRGCQYKSSRCSPICVSHASPSGAVAAQGTPHMYACSGCGLRLQATMTFSFSSSTGGALAPPTPWPRDRHTPGKGQGLTASWWLLVAASWSWSCSCQETSSHWHVAARDGRACPQHSTAAQHSTAQHSTAQHSTAQHSTAQHSTAQHSTAQHSTAQRSKLHVWIQPQL